MRLKSGTNWTRSPTPSLRSPITRQPPRLFCPRKKADPFALIPADEVAQYGSPDPIGGVFWFGVDDTYSTVYVPMYCGINEVPKSYAVGTGDFYHFTWESAFWVFNFVSNYAYSRYSDMITDIQVIQRELEGIFFAEQSEIEKAALTLYKQSPRLAIDYLTEYSVNVGNSTVERWRTLGEELLVKYLDGNVKDELGNVTHPGYPKCWYKRIVDENGELYRMKKLPGETNIH